MEYEAVFIADIAREHGNRGVALDGAPVQVVCTIVDVRPLDATAQCADPSSASQLAVDFNVESHTAFDGTKNSMWHLFGTLACTTTTVRLRAIIVRNVDGMDLMAYMRTVRARRKMLAMQGLLRAAPSRLITPAHALRAPPVTAALADAITAAASAGGAAGEPFAGDGTRRSKHAGASTTAPSAAAGPYGPYAEMPVARLSRPIAVTADGDDGAAALTVSQATASGSTTVSQATASGSTTVSQATASGSTGSDGSPDESAALVSGAAAATDTATTAVRDDSDALRGNGLARTMLEADDADMAGVDGAATKGPAVGSGRLSAGHASIHDR